jgi:Uncharacterized conserved protein (DUF2075)
MRPVRAYYAASLGSFFASSSDTVLGEVARHSGFTIEPSQRDAWLRQIQILRAQLEPWRNEGHLFFEFVVPRMGRRIDVLLIIRHAVFVLEFKVGASAFTRAALDQVWDYALDLKNFHEPSHQIAIAPILIATEAKQGMTAAAMTHHDDGVLMPVQSPPGLLGQCIQQILWMTDGPHIDAQAWLAGRYKPTPTIVEAATALCGQHSVVELTRREADDKNLSVTSTAIDQLIRRARTERRKAICFITGVPGAGKTLVGLDVATQHMDAQSELHSVYLSGNGPLVRILCEALTRDGVTRSRALGSPRRAG